MKNENGPGIEGHVYDEIEELDNSLPKWWLSMFYATIAFSLGYYAYYELGPGPGLVQEYEQERAAMEIAALSKPAAAKVESETELRAMVRDAAVTAAGHAVFVGKCASCHGEKGQGIIGPNLTDDYWIHGGKMTEILTVISAGVAEKGMPPWKPLLTPKELTSVAAYVKSLRGSNPPGAKAPQGQQVAEQ